MTADEADTDEADTDGADAADGSREWQSFALVLPELYVLGVGFAVVTASLLGRTTYLTGYSVPLRLAALAFLTVEMLVPLAVAVDLRRRPDDPDFAWVHAVAIPVVNVVGVAGYVAERRRKLED